MLGLLVFGVVAAVVLWVNARGVFMYVDAVATGRAVLVGGCLTCCLGFLPVVMQTVFQPLFYFERALSLMLLRQMGHDVAARLGP